MTAKALNLIDFPCYEITLWKSPTPDEWLRISNSHSIVHAQDLLIEFPEIISPVLHELNVFVPTTLSGVSALSNLKKLQIYHYWHQINVEYLRNLSSLELSQCPEVKDVSQLGKIERLSLISCSGIVDISQLTSNTKLTILDCPNIVSEWNFQNVRYLNTDLLRFYEQTVDLHQCYSLSLEQFSGSSFCTTNKYLREVTLSRCEPVSASRTLLSNFSHLFRVVLETLPFPSLDLSPLYFVPVVVLMSLKITTLVGLGGNRLVSVYYCAKLKNLKPLRDVPRVLLCGLRGITGGEGLENVFDLTLDDCSDFVNTSALKNVKILTIKGCAALKELKNLAEVSSVSVLDCANLVSMNGLGNNMKITMNRNQLHILKKNPRISLQDYERTRGAPNTNEVVLLRKRVV
jgi:hypothetical protein